MHTAPSQRSMTTLHAGFPKRSLCDQTLAAKLFKRCRGDTNTQTAASMNQPQKIQFIFVFTSQKNINYIVVLVTNPNKRRKKNIQRSQKCNTAI